jgi:hypothetical protein
MREQYAPLFDQHGTEVGTLVTFPNGTRRRSTDPRTYLTTKRGGYKIPPRLWPLFDADGEQVTALALVPGSENRTEAA